MIVCKSREHVELERRTAYLSKALYWSLWFSEKTRRFFPEFVHLAPLRVCCQLVKYHARDL